MKILEEIDHKYSFDKLEKVIDEFDLCSNWRAILDNNKSINLEYKVLLFYKKIFLKYKIDKTKNILDVGSGLCHNYMISNIIGAKCTCLEKIPCSSGTDESNLYALFHKILNIDLTLYYNINSPNVSIPGKFDYILLLNQTFDEKQNANGDITVWGIEDWKTFFKNLSINLNPDGKILVNWTLQQLNDEHENDPLYTSKNGKVVKYQHNKNFKYFKKHPEFNVRFI
jgi:hypothetical protein